jgi:hypothetical protein
MKFVKLAILATALLSSVIGCEPGPQEANPGSKKAATMGSAEAQSTGTVLQRDEAGDK